MDILIMGAQLILSLMIMVGLHEMGHMLPAKFFGMRVEKFFIGFPPRIFSKKIGETEYGLGSIPLGGFVKISGMIDESIDKSQLAGPPKPWEFRSKPAWQRLIVMIGGVTVNAILGITIFILIAYFVGEKYLTKEELNKYGIVAYDLGKKIGFQTGDKILNINGQDFKEDSDLMNPDILLKQRVYYTVQRGNEQLTIELPEDILNKLSNDKGEAVRIFSFAFPFEVESLAEGDAKRAGIKPKDRIVSVNGKPIKAFHELQEELANNRSKKVKIGIDRGGEIIDTEVKVSDAGTIGIKIESLQAFSQRDYSFKQSIQIGINKAFETVYLQIVFIQKMIMGKIAFTKTVSGPLGMAKMFGPEFNFVWFWELTGLISMVLAIMNLLPIPALDGGHVLFLLYEMILQRKPSEKFMEVAQYAGMVVLLSFMAFVFYIEIARQFIR